MSFRSRGSYQAIYDLERVEVINDPQATLFATASVVGAISLMSVRPQPGTSAQITTGYGNYNQALVSGFLNAGNDRFAGSRRLRIPQARRLSKGRRSPVVQLGATRVAGVPAPNLQQIPEETVWNYEVGLKGAVGPVSGSLGVYYQKYDGFQVSVVQSNGTTVTQSAGKASNFGVEAELAVRVADWLRVTDRNYLLDAGNTGGAFGIPTFIPAEPRFFGAAFTARY